MSQHMKALELANATRYARAELKRAVKTREVTVAEILLGGIPGWLKAMPVESLLLCTTRYPWRNYQRLMQGTDTKLTAVVGDLTARKRRLLAEVLSDWDEATERSRARRRYRTTDSARRRAA